MKYMYHTYAQKVNQSIEGVGFPGNRDICGCKPWYRHWKQIQTLYKNKKDC